MSRCASCFGLLERAAWQPGEGSTLYVHVPFCVVKCGYCDFFSVADDSAGAHDAFLTGLEAELASKDLESDPPPTVFVGGGTPSYLDPQRLERLFALIGRHVDLESRVEVTMEANPESLTEEKASIAREAGVDRLSIGAQTFDETRLGELDRAHDAAAIEAAVQAARAARFDNVSLDLIFGLPGQTLDSWEADVTRALQLGPDHLSCYNLVFEPGTRFRRDLERGVLSANDPEHDLQLFDRTRELLSANGFHAYEISNFAGRGGPCRHNDHYWLQGDYRGVGPGAASHAAGHRATNSRSLKAWSERVERGEPAHGREVETLTAVQRLGEALWLGLRRHDGVDLEQITSRIGIDLDDATRQTIDRLGHMGHLVREGSRVSLSPRGIRVADAIAEQFLIPPTP